MTIIGTGFSTIPVNNVVTMSDGTLCHPHASSTTEIACTMAAFDRNTIDKSSPYTLTVDVHGSTDDQQQLSLYAIKLDGMGVDPASVSPILKTWVTVTLNSDYPENMVKEDFTATLHSVNDPENFADQEMYIHSVFNSNKSLLIKFPGAPSGEYSIQINSATLGRVDDQSLHIVTEARITAISATSGSNKGG